MPDPRTVAIGRRPVLAGPVRVLLAAAAVAALGALAPTAVPAGPGSWATQTTTPAPAQQ